MLKPDKSHQENVTFLCLSFYQIEHTTNAPRLQKRDVTLKQQLLHVPAQQNGRTHLKGTSQAHTLCVHVNFS